MKTPGVNRMKSERGRAPRDYYQTPHELADAALNYLISSEKFWRSGNMLGNLRARILDPGCGSGVWCQSAYYNFTSGSPYFRRPTIHGVDLEPQIDGEIHATIIQEDFLNYEPEGGLYDAIVGNPPYSLAEEFVRKSATLVRDRGYIYFLLQLNFLGSRKREIGLFRDFPLKEVVVLSRRPSFFAVDGKQNSTDTVNYAMFLWQKGYRGNTIINWLHWNYLET